MTELELLNRRQNVLERSFFETLKLLSAIVDMERNPGGVNPFGDLLQAFHEVSKDLDAQYKKEKAADSSDSSEPSDSKPQPAQHHSKETLQ